MPFITLGFIAALIFFVLVLRTFVILFSISRSGTTWELLNF